MSKSVRLRTQVGKDQSLTFNLNQDFEFIEILSLKLSQNEIYTRQCADYGVVVGRISINNGFGIPNAKLSIFIPISAEDEVNPIINSIYPYKSPEEINEDGFRYNLLPYKPSYPGHSATGSFPDLEDVLTNSTAVEIYDKYYKFTVTTNDSGDFMLFGIPTGSQKLVMNVDLSDIGPFSQSPQDLIRIGLATESQVNGVKFQTSENLFSLPQIVSVTQQVTVNPLWGDEELCQISITRADIDLTQTKNIEIKPTAIFMGSIFSDSDRGSIKKKCKPPLKSGNLCSLNSGPGQILSLRQTIRQDLQGRPVLEEYELENNGNVIDENGTWLLDVPMNLDYITTNEFGEQVFSNDEKKGIPTRGKYRFKIKWNQSPDLSLPVRRANFLVPNVKEHGWNSSDEESDPFLITDPTNEDYKLFKASYAFSLNWDDYGVTGDTVGEKIIQEAIDCKDKFYDMSYNKVYTISQLITRYTKGAFARRYSGIKAITDDECESTTNKFPSNDAQFKPDFLFTVFSVLIIFLSILLKIFVKVLHVVCKLLSDILDLLNKIDGKAGINLSRAINAVQQLLEGLSGFNLPMYTYPDCELCDCKPAGTAAGGIPNGIFGSPISPFRNNSVLADLIDTGQYESQLTNGDTDFTPIAQIFYAGLVTNNTSRAWGFKTPQIQLFKFETAGGSSGLNYFWTTTLPLHERATLQTAKGKFFGSGFNRVWINPSEESPFNQYISGGETYYLGGGTTQVKVCFNTQLNNPNQDWDFQYDSGTGKFVRTSLLTTVQNSTNLGFHYDNIFILLTEEKYESETLLTFENPFTYNDVNLSGTVTNQFGTNSVTGTSINNGQQNISVSHTHPMTGKRLITKYNISGNSLDNQFLRFPTGMEYYQVITSTTVSEMLTIRDNNPDGVMQDACYYNRVFESWTRFVNMDAFSRGLNYNWTWENGWSKYSDKSAVYVTILMRGVDPHSTSQPMKIGLGRIFAKINHWENSVYGNFKLNIPMQPNDGLDFGFSGSNSSQADAQNFAHRCVRHELIPPNNNSTSIDTGYSKGRLFFKSYHFQPSQNNWTSFTTKSPYNFISTSEYDVGINMLTGFAPDPNLSIETSNFFTFLSTTQGRGIRIGARNYYSYGGNVSSGEGDVGITGPATQAYNNRSYQPGESVEGIPFMCLGGVDGFSLPDNPDFVAGIQRSTALNSIYYSRKYPDSDFTMSNNERIVMRSDRLPTSDLYQKFQANTMGGMANGHFKLYEIPIEGVVTSGESQPQQLTFQISEPEPPEPGETPNSISTILETFSCQSLVPVNCYSSANNGESITVAPIGNCTYQSYTDRNGTAFNTQFFIEGSCYSLVRPPYNQRDNVKNDRELINEWASRININFGACREVFSHLFVNNWINGTLYMVPFRTTRYFTGPFDNPPNQPYNKYCKDTVFLHPDDFNFYYRSAPYEDFVDGGNFLGRNGNKYLGQTVGNTKNHMYPTTIMDLGPRDELQKYLSQSGNWDGYIMNQLSPTSFGDTSELLNLFVLSRLANTSFTNVFKARGASVLNFFDSRKKRFVDGDFAQMIATNSQFGVDSYDPENYPEPPPNTNFSSSLYLRTNFSSPKDVVFGIFYNGNEQSRDYISPNRTVYDDTADIGDPCAIGSIPVTTQTVPFYLWELKINPKSNIFGAQSNDWKFDTFSYQYQKIDRLIPYQDSYVYQPASNINQIKYHKGWIYNVEPIINPATEEFDYKPEPSLSLGPYLFGAPYYFYFGLINGASAFDRFAAKWIDTENIV